MARMTKRRAKALQPKIAMYVLGGKHRTQALFVNGWDGRVVHVADTVPRFGREKHCLTCRCVAQGQVISLCKAAKAMTWRIGLNLDRKMPCKSCLKQLSRIANGG